MAEKITTTLIDDLDGTIAEETVLFGLDGIDYAIDLNKDHATDLRAVLLAHAAKGRQASPRPRERRSDSEPGDKARNKAIRDWANAHGMNIAVRGRLPRIAIEQYNQRNNT